MLRNIFVKNIFMKNATNFLIDNCESLVFHNESVNCLWNNNQQKRNVICFKRSDCGDKRGKKSGGGDDDGGNDDDDNNSSKKSRSLVRHNYDCACEEFVNKQVQMELYAAYWYTSLQYHFDRDDIALTGFSNYFKAAAAEELVHADKFMYFQVKRGGKLKFLPIDVPPENEWTAACALAQSIELEKQVTKSIEEMASLAAEKCDDHFNDFLCAEFLVEQYKSLKDLANLLSRVKRAGPGCGLVVIDGELNQLFTKK